MDIDALCHEVIRRTSAVHAQFEDLEKYNDVLGFTYVRTVRDIAALLAGGNILEVGFFTGVVSISLARLGYRVTATDIPFVANEPPLRQLLEQEGVSVVPFELSQTPLPWPDATFDAIVFNEVVEHLPFNCIPLLRELGRVLTADGRVYCATPNLASLDKRIRLALGRDIFNPIGDLVANLEPNKGISVGLHWREFTKQALIDLYAAAGLHCVSHRYIDMNPHQGHFPKRQVKRMAYRMFPALMSGQVGVFARDRKSQPSPAAVPRSV